MNPCAEDFIEAFDEVNADVIFVFPNNGNIILTAQQAAHLYDKADVRVIESKTIGAGYAALTMLDTGSGDTDAIVEDLRMAMDGVITAEISHCVRDASIDGAEMHAGDYIGFVGKELLAINENRLAAVCETIDKIGFAKYDVCIVFCGKEANDAEAEQIEKYIHSHYRGKEVYITKGDQDVYDYIMIVE
jgi:dihydroxyacetone kinase-like predicted kinase